MGRVPAFFAGPVWGPRGAPRSSKKRAKSSQEGSPKQFSTNASVRKPSSRIYELKFVSRCHFLMILWSFSGSSDPLKSCRRGAYFHIFDLLACETLARAISDDFGTQKRLQNQPLTLRDPSPNPPRHLQEPPDSPQESPKPLPRPPQGSF